MWYKTVSILRIAGFSIRADASWFVIGALIVWSLSAIVFPAQMPAAGRWVHLAMAVVAMLGIVISLIVHELAHVGVARRYGVHCPCTTLFLFGGVGDVQSDPVSVGREVIMAGAGPLASLGLSLALWFCAVLSDVTGPFDALRVVLSYLAEVNLGLALVNLLPAYPLDGGRVYRAVLWSQSGDLQQATQKVTALSGVIAYVLIALGLAAIFLGQLALGLWPLVIGLLVLATARATLARARAEASLSGQSVALLMTRTPWLAKPDLSLDDLVNRVFLDHAITFAPVVEDGTLIGCVDMQMVRRIDRENWSAATVEDVIEAISDTNTVPPEMSGRTLLRRVLTTGRRKFLVVDPQGLVGVITLSDLLAFLRTAQAAGDL